MDIKPENDERQLDRLLQRRNLEAPQGNLAERIVMAALRHPQQQPVTFGVLLARVCAEFMLPKPAYALSVMLLFGVMLGVAFPLNGNTGDDSQDTTYMQEFLYEDEVML